MEIKKENIFCFKIKRLNLDYMLKHSINRNKLFTVYRSINCDFMKLFEKKISFVENFNSQIEKNNYIFNVNPKRFNTTFLRINGTCKFCKTNLNKNSPVFIYVI